jgi:hypothetical protein
MHEHSPIRHQGKLRGHVRHQFEFLFAMTLLPGGGVEPRTAGRSLHSSSSQLNLSRFHHLNPSTTQRVLQKVLTSSRKVDECKPLVAGDARGQVGDGGPGNRAGMTKFAKALRHFV